MRRHLGFRGEANVKAVLLGRRVMGLSAWPSPIGVIHRLGQGSQMPLAKMSGGVALILENFRQGDLFRFEMTGVGVRDSVTEGMPSRQTTSSRGRANRRSGVEARETNAIGRHGVQVRSLDDPVPIEPHIAPAQIVGHQEHDVGLGRLKTTCEQAPPAQAEAERTAHRPSTFETGGHAIPSFPNRDPTNLQSPPAEPARCGPCPPSSISARDLRPNCKSLWGHRAG